MNDRIGIEPSRSRFHDLVGISSVSLKILRKTSASSSYMGDFAVNRARVRKSVCVHPPAETAVKAAKPVEGLLREMRRSYLNLKAAQALKREGVTPERKVF